MVDRTAEPIVMDSGLARREASDDTRLTQTGITDDEFFSLSTLCGTLTVDAQRTHMRRFFPQFVDVAGGNVRSFTMDMLAPWRLRSPWMRTRLVRMAHVLGERNHDMASYTNNLRQMNVNATSEAPMPAFNALTRDHGGGGHKTLSIFIRDCVLGNCFLIDSCVKRILQRYDLPATEQTLVSAVLALDLNPRNVARLFYNAGGGETFFTQ